MKNSIPISKIFNTIRNNIILISMCILITIATSFYYNKHFKLIKYDYLIKMNVINKLLASNIGLNEYSQIQSLTKSKILEYLREMSPSDYEITIADEDFTVQFRLNKLIDTTGFLNQTNKRIREEIISVIEDNFKNTIDEANYIKTRINSELTTLNIKKNFLEKYLKDVKNDGDTVFSKANLQNFRNDYKKTILRTIELNGYLSEFQLIRNDEELVRLAGRFLEKSFRQTTYPSINFQKYFFIKEHFQKFKDSNQTVLFSVSDWKIKSNEFSIIEIVIMGVLFGIFLSFVVIFFTSDYFRKSIFYPK